MTKKNVEAIYPLAPLQEGILFHSLYSSSQSSTYLIQLQCTISGKVDTSALHRAWQTVIGRHHIFRTAFIWERGEKPLQVVLRK